MGTSIDLSLDGMLLRHRRVTEPRERALLRFALPGRPLELQITAGSSGSKKVALRAGNGVSIRFDTASDSQRHQLRSTSSP